MDKTQRWHIIRYQLNEAMPACEACGHDIKHTYLIQNEQGQQMTVGSECVNTWCAPDEKPNAERLAKRAARAAREWRDHTIVKPLGETRQDYINRRVAEMANALAACKEWSSNWGRKGNEPNWIETLEQKHNANRRDFLRPVWDVRRW